MKHTATSEMHGAKTLVKEGDLMLKRVIADRGGRTPTSFPDTSYYLPTILGMTGEAVEKVSDLEPIMQQARKMLKSLPRTSRRKPNRVVRPDAGMAALFAAETIEAIRFACEMQPEPALEVQSAQGAVQEGEQDDRLGRPIDDIHVRAWGIQLLSGRMPGIAVIVGCAKNNAVALKIVQEMRCRNILCFLSGNVNGRSIIHQLQEDGLELGCDTCVVPLGIDASSTVHGLGFATRIALMFGGFKPGMSREILSYSKDRVLGFVLALGELDDVKFAAAAGARHFGFPFIADSVVSRIKPKSGRADELIFSLPFDSLDGKDDAEKVEQLVQKCIEACGMKVKLSNVGVPVQYGLAFDGDLVRNEDVRVEFGGPRSRCFELLQIAKPVDVIDGKIEVIGPDFAQVEQQGSMDMGIVVKVSGRKLRSDFEPLLERQINGFINCANGIQVSGQRDRAWIRISRAAARDGFSLVSFGKILQARFREDFGAVVDKMQVTLITEPKLHAEWLAKARRTYQDRDLRLAGLTDDTVEDFYSCTLCQSFAPNHVCLISPERPGICGAYDWQGCMASYRINPAGPIRPIKLGKQIDVRKGLWKGTNRAVKILSRGVVNEVSMYSIMDKPMTTCCATECVVMLIPEANGVMVVGREDTSTTPAGMPFSTLACIAGSSPQNPGLMGVGKLYLNSPKFLSADGGFKRVVWMSSVLKETMAEELEAVCAREGDPDLLNKIADEKNVTSVEELLAWLHAHRHPAMAMEPMF